MRTLSAAGNATTPPLWGVSIVSVFNLCFFFFLFFSSMHGQYNHQRCTQLNLEICKLCFQMPQIKVSCQFYINLKTQPVITHFCPTHFLNKGAPLLLCRLRVITCSAVDFEFYHIIKTGRLGLMLPFYHNCKITKKKTGPKLPSQHGKRC